VADLAIIVISTNESEWLPPCLESIEEHAGGADIDVVVVDNESTDGTRELVERRFPKARVVRCTNHGFGHANNRGLDTVTAPFVLFLNPDTEIQAGTFGQLLDELTERPQVGLVGVRHVTGDGELFPTIRRFPTLSRMFGEALASERFPVRADWLGERELDDAAYDREQEIDWTTGAYLLARKSVLDSVGAFDERFFLFAEEVDLCLRIKRAGWQIRHLPSMTIVHHADKAGWNPRMTAQGAYARKQYFEKNFGSVESRVALAALLLRHGLRALVGGRGSAPRKAASRLALRTLLGLAPPPFQGRQLTPRPT
jgi:N-acetylglucosaminyl-diphospho-decaprenol L-rhamnosyltransferase